MKKTAWCVVVVCVAFLLSGCATTPESIKTLSAVELQMWSAVEQDFAVTVDRYDKEVHHWVNLAFGQAMQQAERKLTRPDGSIDALQYKQQANQVAMQMAGVLARYERDKEAILLAFNDKIRKAKLIQFTIAEFENSTGVSPESLEALLAETSTSVESIRELYERRSPVEADETAPIEWDQLFDMLLGGRYTEAYREVLRVLDVQVPTSPVPESDVK